MKKLSKPVQENRQNSAAGVSLVELALIMPLLTLIIFGTLDLGWGVYANNTLSLGATEGARKGIISSVSDATIRQRVKDVTIGLNLADSDIVISPDTTRSSGGFISVTVSYSYRPFTPLIAAFIPGGSIPLSAKATMYVE